MFKQLQSVFTLLPKVLAVVQLVEELLDPSVDGVEKKRVALEALRNAGVSESLMAIASGLIDTVVAVLNALGVFDREGVVGDEQLASEVAGLKRAGVEAMKPLEFK